MRVRSLGFLALVLGGFVPCLAQQPTAPASQENAVTADGAEKPDAPEAKPTDAGPARPAGTLVRPKDGVKHTDLDAAWQKYDLTMTGVTDECLKVIKAKLEEAKKGGNLDIALKWDAALKAAVSEGVIPDDRDFVREREQLRKKCDAAKKALGNVYDGLTKRLTIDGDLLTGKNVRDEWLAVSSVVAAAESSVSPEKKKSDGIGRRRVVPDRVIVLTIHVTSDWAGVTVLPADAVAVQNQEVLKGQQKWDVKANEVGFAGRVGQANDDEIRVTCRVADTVNQISLRTSKGFIGVLSVEVSCLGKVIQRCDNMKNHGDTGQEFQIAIPR